MSKQSENQNKAATNPLLEVSPYDLDEGEVIGRGPRKVLVEDWNSRPFVTGLKAIRAKCMDCCCGSFSEVRKCTVTGCPLWPLRMGTVPKTYREQSTAQPAQQGG